MTMIMIMLVVMNDCVVQYSYGDYQVIHIIRKPTSFSENLMSKHHENPDKLQSERWVIQKYLNDTVP